MNIVPRIEMADWNQPLGKDETLNMVFGPGMGSAIQPLTVHHSILSAIFTGRVRYLFAYDFIYRNLFDEDSEYRTSVFFEIGSLVDGQTLADNEEMPAGDYIAIQTLPGLGSAT